MPLFLDLLLAVGAAAIEKYIIEYLDEAVTEIYCRLYPCVLT